jgi:PAS domain S-box-containing protein
MAFIETAALCAGNRPLPRIASPAAAIALHNPACPRWMDPGPAPAEEQHDDEPAGDRSRSMSPRSALQTTVAAAPTEVDDAEHAGGVDVEAPRILLVDEDAGRRAAARLALEKEGFVVLEAATGAEALARIGDRPSFAIVDIGLPDTDPDVLARRIRDAAERRVPILHVSSSATDPDAKAAALEAGAEAYLPGPVEPAVLVATVRALLRATRAEESADRRALHWQATFDSISDGVVLLDPDGTILNLNRTAAQLLAIESVDAVGKRLDELLDLPQLSEPSLLTSGERVELESSHGRRWLRLTYDPMRDSDARREGTVVTIGDVTDQRRIDLALADALRQQQRQSVEVARASAAEQAYRQLLEAVVDEMPVGVIVAEPVSGRPIIVNGEIGRIIGHDVDEPAAVVATIVANGSHPDGRPYRPDDWPLQRSIAAGETVRDEEIDLARGDGTRGTISVSAMPIRREDGEVVAAVATVNDITRRREAENLRDAFIGVLSHELRTPITSIFGGSKVLLREGAELTPEIQRTILEDLAAEADRLNRMVENLLVLTRVERGVTLSGQEPVLLQRLLPRIVAEEARQWPSLRIDLRVSENVPTVAGDESFIDQVLRNFLSNAGKYGPPSGTVTIDVRPEMDQGQVCVAVLDEGIGIEAGEANQLFDLFFRSATVASKTAGSGIGLFVSRHLVEGMGGRVWARARPEGGSEFGFSLPAYEVV